MRPHNILVVSMVFMLTIPLFGQKKDYRYGYVINLKGDTLRGNVMDRSSGSFATLQAKVSFRPEKGRKKKYRPYQILGYGYGNSEFESVPLQEEADFFRVRYMSENHSNRVFLQVIHRNEKLIWYRQEFMQNDNNHIDSFPLFYKPGSEEMVRVTQGVLGLKRKRLTEYFSDCPGLVAKIMNKEFSKPDEVYFFYIQNCGKR